MELVKTSNLKKYYRTGEICVKALDQVNLSVEEGEFIAVVGPSGCGKTTLLNMLGGLDNPTEGTVLIHGKDITKMKSEELTVYRRKHIGFVFQNYNLLQTLNVKSNILLPLYLGNSKIDEAYFEEIVEILGIKNKLKNLPNTLSGGQAPEDVIERMIGAKVIPLSDFPEINISERAKNAIMKGISIRAEDRYASMDSLICDLYEETIQRETFFRDRGDGGWQV